MTQTYRPWTHRTLEERLALIPTDRPVSFAPHAKNRKICPNSPVWYASWMVGDGTSRLLYLGKDEDGKIQARAAQPPCGPLTCKEGHTSTVLSCKECSTLAYVRYLHNKVFGYEENQHE